MRSCYRLAYFPEVRTSFKTFSFTHPDVWLTSPHYFCNRIKISIRKLRHVTKNILIQLLTYLLLWSTDVGLQLARRLSHRVPRGQLLLAAPKDSQGVNHKHNNNKYHRNRPRESRSCCYLTTGQTHFGRERSSLLP